MVTGDTLWYFTRHMGKRRIGLNMDIRHVCSCRLAWEQLESNRFLRCLNKGKNFKLPLSILTRELSLRIIVRTLICCLAHRN